LCVDFRTVDMLVLPRGALQVVSSTDALPAAMSQDRSSTLHECGCHVMADGLDLFFSNSQRVGLNFNARSMFSTTTRSASTCASTAAGPFDEAFARHISSYVRLTALVSCAGSPPQVLLALAHRKPVPRAATELPQLRSHAILHVLPVRPSAVPAVTVVLRCRNRTRPLLTRCGFWLYCGHLNWLFL
jgi:hypothetical protein